MKNRILITFIVFLVLNAFSQAAPSLKGKSGDINFIAEPIVTDLHIPWGFEFLSSKEILIAEKNGNLSIFNMDTKKRRALTGGPKVHETGQGGLMDVRKHPNYRDTPWIYVSFTEEIKGRDTTSLSRFKIKGNKIVSLEKLLTAKAFSDTGRHFGSRIAFDSKGYLFLSIGERGVRKNSQDGSTHAGSILRLHDDGLVPKDNPFVNKKGYLPELWSIGHRNPQGMVFDKATGRLWAIEHGPRGGDEINLIEKGKNYGWPVISYGKEYSSPAPVGESTKKPGMMQPVYQYTPSIAPCGLEIYTGSVFKSWKGNLFTGALKLTHLNRVVLNGTKFKKEERLLKDLNRRFRNVKQGPDELLYFSTDSGEIYQIKPSKSSNAI